MNSYNTTGNLANDPELKKVGETSVLNFTVASNINKDTVVYNDCALWGKLGESLSSFLTKGKPVTIFGELSGINAYVKKDGDANATIHYLNSGGVQIGSITLIAGASLLLHKRRTYHKFYATSADVKAVPCAILR